MQKYEEFEVCFTKLGSEPNLSEDLFEFLEEYNAGRSLKKKQKRHNKIIDLSLLPPCKSVLRLHSKRANAVGYLWGNASNPTVEFLSLTENGWTITSDIDWIEEAFPAVYDRQFRKMLKK